MKYKCALLAILLAMLLITPAFSFWHPPPDKIPCTFFGVMINGEWGNATVPYKFIEPEDNYCDNVTVEVWISNVTDLYGYEFKLKWDTTYFDLLSWTVSETWPSQFVVKPDALYDGASPYHQAVVAMAPSTGVSGDFLLATLVFHIVNDVCWYQCPYVAGKFDLFDTKASDSCSGIIKLCTEYDGHWRFYPVKPEVYIEPDEEINWKVGDKFTLEIWVHNVTKMKSLHFELDWKWRLQDRLLKNGTTDYIWIDLLNVSKSDVTINEAIFPEKNRTSSIVLKDKVLDSSMTFWKDTLTVDIEMDCTYPLINGTFVAVTIVFTKLDPWYCGRQPEYIPPKKVDDHNWQPENATTPIWFEWGYIDVMCPEKKNIYFGKMQQIGPFLTQPAGYPPFDYYPAEFWLDIYGDCKMKWWFHMLGNSTPWVGDGHWGLDLVISYDGITPAYKIHNNDGWNATWAWGTWLYSPWNAAIKAFDHTATKPVSSLTWVHATGDRDVATNPNGWFTITIDKGYLGYCFYYAIWVGVGGFWPPNKGYSSYPAGFDWNYPKWIPPYDPMQKVCKSSYNEATYIFMPIPGDLDGNGHVDIVDVMIIAGFYGYSATWPNPAKDNNSYYATYYDLNKDCIVDIYDIVIVAKNFCRSAP